MDNNQATPADYLTRAYRNVFLSTSTAQEGQAVLMDLIDKCKVFTVNTKSPHDAAVLEGKRAIGIQLFYMVGLTPDHGHGIDLTHLANITKVIESAHNYNDVIKTATKNNQKENDDD